MRPDETYLIDSGAGLRAEVVAYGASLAAVHVDGRQVVLGHSTLAQYHASPHFMGSSIGRYANRLAHAQIEVAGRRHQLQANEGVHLLHGGARGFDSRTWQVDEADVDRVVLSLRSLDGENGFPGEVRAEVRYLVRGTSLHITYRATTDAPTELNLTNHAYLNLDGHGTVAGHLLEVHADQFTPTDDEGLALGRLVSVAHTDLDLRQARRLGALITSADPFIAARGGLDHNLVLRRPAACGEPTTGESRVRPVARLTSSNGDLQATLSTDQAGLQVYTANGFDGRAGTPMRHHPHAGIALEPQAHPGTAQHPALGSTVVMPGQEYRNRIVWDFSNHHHSAGSGA